MPDRRVAVIAGCRTPFARSGTALRDLSAVELGKACVRELLERTEVDPAAIGAVVMGQVVPSVQAPNLAREVGLGAGLPKEVPAHTVNRACASASQAIADVAAEIRLGNLDAGIAGGAESLSNVPIPLSRRLARALVESQRAKSMGARLSILGTLRPRDLVPEWPAVAEPSTGLTMGQSAEKMAKENGISRDEQDRIALASHRNAWAATEDGRLGQETCPVFVPPRYERGERRQPAAPGHLARGARRAAARLRQEERQRHRRQLLGADRRRGGRAADVRGEGARRGPRAAGVRPLLGRGRRRSRRTAVDGARARRAEGARAGGRRARRDRPDRDARGVRGAGGVEHPGARVGELGAREARALAAGRDGRSRSPQRLRGLDRARAPVRGDGSAARHDARQRDGAARRAARPGLGLRAGRDGLRDGAGAMSGAFTAERGAGGVVVLTLDVPGEKVNTLGRERIAEFEALLDEVEKDAAVRAVVIRSGKPDNFIAGADIKDFTRIRSAEEGEALSRAAHAVLGRVEGCRVPVVAAIHGSCLGFGTELSLACRYRVASDDPKTAIGLPEVMLGILPGAGGTQRLPRLVGLAGGARHDPDRPLAEGRSGRSARGSWTSSAPRPSSPTWRAAPRSAWPMDGCGPSARGSRSWSSCCGRSSSGGRAGRCSRRRAATTRRRSWRSRWSRRARRRASRKGWRSRRGPSGGSR